MPHTTQIHVVERYRIVDGGKALDVSVHVEDPGAINSGSLEFTPRGDPLPDKLSRGAPEGAVWDGNARE